MLSNPALGFTAEMMSEYVRFVGNHLLGMLGLEPFYRDAKQPFEFMDMQSLMRKTNFFESKVSEYSKVRESDRSFTVDADF
jgi:ribonucleotide reductase beta subunit family protein with ferritin-like domain